MDNLLKKTIITALIVLIVYLALYLFIDRAIDTTIHEICSENAVCHLGKDISAAATGSYIKLLIAAALILIVVVDPRLKRHWTRNLLFICVSCSIAVIIGEGLKFLLARHRPIMLFEHNKYGLEFFSTKWELNSTPSGHTLRAFSILTALSLLYRRYTLLFIFIAILIGASRVVVTAHYPSDVLFGGFIGVFSAIWTHRYFFSKNQY